MARKKTGGTEYIHHTNAIRMRVTGSGSLKLYLNSLDNIQVQTLVPLTMAAATDREPIRLVNFKSQRVQLEGKTTEINERITHVHRIIIFMKPVETEFPG